MHKAFRAVRLIRGNHYDFESITCFENYLLIGTKSGQILMYEITPLEVNSDDVFVPALSIQTELSKKTTKFTTSVNDPSESSSNSPTLNVKLCVSHNFSKKRIQQLQAVPEYGFFLVLTEFQLSAHSLSNRQLVAVVPNSKGASCFAIQYQSPGTESWKGDATNGKADLPLGYFLLQYRTYFHGPRWFKSLQQTPDPDFKGPFFQCRTSETEFMPLCETKIVFLPLVPF